MNQQIKDSFDLIRITSDYFCAGVILDSIHLVCVDSAPILKYMIGKKFSWIKSYCDKKCWKLEYRISNDKWDSFKTFFE